VLGKCHLDGLPTCQSDSYPIKTLSARLKRLIFKSEFAEHAQTGRHEPLSTGLVAGKLGPVEEDYAQAGAGRKQSGGGTGWAGTHHRQVE
jgi:hypothetical protein